MRARRRGNFSSICTASEVPHRGGKKKNGVGIPVSRLPSAFTSLFKAPHQPPRLFSRCVSCASRCSAHARASTGGGATATQGPCLGGNNIAPSLCSSFRAALLVAATAFKHPPPPLLLLLLVPCMNTPTVHRARTGKRGRKMRHGVRGQERRTKNRREKGWQGRE